MKIHCDTQYDVVNLPAFITLLKVDDDHHVDAHAGVAVAEEKAAAASISGRHAKFVKVCIRQTNETETVCLRVHNVT